MKWTSGLYTSDRLQLTRWELIKLFFGITIKGSPRYPINVSIHDQQ